MKYSRLFGKTIKDTPKDASLISHKLLYKAGYIRESTAGRYYLLPLGLRVQQKIQAIIKQELDKAGAQEIITPILHPKALWEETNRTSSVGFELMTIKDRNEMEFVLGGTAEEMIVDLVRKFQLSYKNLPFHIYQFSTKFRDELRARGGLLRLREFLMKDGYSFHDSEEDFKREYQNMMDTYTKIFERVGLTPQIVEADNGYIGGEYSHEFVVESDAGESRYFTDGEYFAHEDIASFTLDNASSDEEMKGVEDVEGKGIIGVEGLAEYLKIPVEKTTKTILFETDTGRIIAAAVRGGFDINEEKLVKIVGCRLLKLASAEVVKKITGAKVGYAGVLNLPKEVKIYFDESCANRRNFETGANRTNFHTINVNFGRDLPQPEQFYDFKIAKEGFIGPNGQKLVAKKGIEVGNIFQLGFHYSSKMKGAQFIDADGKKKPYYMGCYGIGLARTLAAIVEVSNDDKGIIWPEAVAPFMVHIVGLDMDDSSVKNEAERVYKLLQAEGIEVLFDDRSGVSAGEKFADADLIGIPYRVVISKKTHSTSSGQAKDKLEVKKRNEKETKFLTFEELLKIIQS
ncbi:MAG: prolyl-tRNA synthetase [Microgenomates group bacterium Gr01-1014_7]|nr:MAG: prolyl-tRNA synthetase [Microgenomates group bacterium Gr01-1014_7]